MLLTFIISALAIAITAYLLPGIQIDSYITVGITALVLGLINGFIKPVLTLLTLPINILTLGLFSLVINALLILLASEIVPGFEVSSFWWALIFSIVLSIITSALGSILKSD